jgi:hypothetical protein
MDLPELKRDGVHLHRQRLKSSNGKAMQLSPQPPQQQHSKLVFLPLLLVFLTQLPPPLHLAVSFRALFVQLQHASCHLPLISLLSQQYLRLFGAFFLLLQAIFEAAAEPDRHQQLWPQRQQQFLQHTCFLFLLFSQVFSLLSQHYARLFAASLLFLQAAFEARYLKLLPAECKECSLEDPIDSHLQKSQQHA